MQEDTAFSLESKEDYGQFISTSNNEDYGIGFDNFHFFKKSAHDTTRCKTVARQE